LAALYTLQIKNYQLHYLHICGH